MPSSVSKALYLFFGGSLQTRPRASRVPPQWGGGMDEHVHSLEAALAEYGVVLRAQTVDRQEPAGARAAAGAGGGRRTRSNRRSASISTTCPPPDPAAAVELATSFFAASDDSSEAGACASSPASPPAPALAGASAAALPSPGMAPPQKSSAGRAPAPQSPRCYSGCSMAAERAPRCKRRGPRSQGRAVQGRSHLGMRYWPLRWRTAQRTACGKPRKRLNRAPYRPCSPPTPKFVGRISPARTDSLAFIFSLV